MTGLLSRSESVCESLVELSRGEKLDRHATSNSSFSFTAEGKSFSPPAYCYHM